MVQSGVADLQDNAAAELVALSLSRSSEAAATFKASGMWDMLYHLYSLLEAARETNAR